MLPRDKDKEKATEMAEKLTTIGFDADDTLWHNEQIFRLTQDKFAELLSDYVAKNHLYKKLLEAERRNLGHYGFGVKGFVLSMIETAIDVSEDRVPARIIRKLIDAGQEMLTHPIQLLPYAREVIVDLSDKFRLVLITKGDLLDQERKLAQSGLGDFFQGVEIVSNKTPDVYTQIFSRYGHDAKQAMMVGNSLRSDILPAIEAGSWGVYVPHDLTWELEQDEAPQSHPKYHALKNLGGLQKLLKDLC